MKTRHKIILVILFIILISSFGYGQTTIKVYNNNNGLPSIIPTQTIKQSPTGNYEVYDNHNGLPGIMPVEVIVPSRTNNNQYDVYPVTNGMPTIVPTKTIILENTDVIYESIN